MQLHRFLCRARRKRRLFSTIVHSVRVSRLYKIDFGRRANAIFHFHSKSKIVVEVVGRVLCVCVQWRSRNALHQECKIVFQKCFFYSNFETILFRCIFWNVYDFVCLLRVNSIMKLLVLLIFFLSSPGALAKHPISLRACVPVCRIVFKRKDI